MYYYDVCNDYSLELREKPESFKGYRTSKRELVGQTITLYIHCEYNEVHFASCKDPIKAQYL